MIYVFNFADVLLAGHFVLRHANGTRHRLSWSLAPSTLLPSWVGLTVSLYKLQSSRES